MVVNNKGVKKVLKNAAVFDLNACLNVKKAAEH